MPLNAVPNRPVTDAEAQEYEREGVVCLRQVFDPEWIESLGPPARRLLIEKQDLGLLPSYPGRYLARKVPEFRRFVFESPLAEAAARTLRSREVRFFFDELFAKAPRSDDKTIWHNDRMGWPTHADSRMIPSLWIPLTPITTANSLEVIVRTHHDDVPYWLFSPNARKMIRPPDRVPHPDGEAMRRDPTYAGRFRTWDMALGDMLVVHPWALHYSHGNPTDGWRIALSVRVFGDDVRWAPRPDCLNIAGCSFDEMIEGERPAGDLFPLLWSVDGRRDDDSRYPRGFATSWEHTRRKDEINEGALFNRLRREAQG
jgi:hypothetical protein